MSNFFSLKNGLLKQVLSQQFAALFELSVFFVLVSFYVILLISFSQTVRAKVV